MERDHCRKRNLPNLLSIAIVVTITMIVITPLTVPAMQQPSFTQGQQQQQPMNNTDGAAASSSNQSGTTASSANITAAEGPGSVLRLSQANIALDISLMKGYENGHEIFFIATDASDNKTAAMITNETGFKVNFAPILAQAPEAAHGQAYVFTNGIPGQGPLGFQLPIVNAKPGDQDYSPLWQTNFVKWNDNATARELKSVEEIMAAQSNGELTITNTNIIVNSPAIKWQGGELQVKQNKTITDDTSYGGGQVLNIDTQNMVVTMVAHRGWGPDGKSIYYIVTDATPEMPATMMGVTNVPLEEQLATAPVAVDLFQFMNGINGSGPMGFQAGIGAANPDDANYSPMWRISFIEWKDPSKARILETVSDINAMAQAEMITITPAMNGTHVVNCPFFDQSTVFEHQSKSLASS
jgi:hypothetical protein